MASVNLSTRIDMDFFASYWILLNRTLRPFLLNVSIFDMLYNYFVVYIV